MSLRLLVNGEVTSSVLNLNHCLSSSVVKCEFFVSRWLKSNVSWVLFSRLFMVVLCESSSFLWPHLNYLCLFLWLIQQVLLIHLLHCLLLCSWLSLTVTASMMLEVVIRCYNRLFLTFTASVNVYFLIYQAWWGCLPTVWVIAAFVISAVWLIRLFAKVQDHPSVAKADIVLCDL